MARVFVYGTSTEYGHNDTEGGGYPERIKREFMQQAIAGERPTTALLNFSVSGQPLPPIVRRLSGDVEHYRRGVSVGVFAIGSTDAIIRPGESSPKVPYEQFLESLSMLGRICAVQEVWPIFVGPTPIREGAYAPFSRNGDTIQPSTGRQYRQAVIEHAALVGAPYIHAGQLLLDQGLTIDSIVSSDNVHPGVEAHRIMAEIVGRELQRVLVQARGSTSHQENSVPF